MKKTVSLFQRNYDGDRLVRDKIKVGQLSAEAPSGYDPVVWTPADELRLDSALAKRAAHRLQKR